MDYIRAKSTSCINMYFLKMCVSKITSKNDKKADSEKFKIVNMILEKFTEKNKKFLSYIIELFYSIFSHNYSRYFLECHYVSRFFILLSKGKGRECIVFKGSVFRKAFN